MWKAALWDKPQNGARYCVRRRDPDGYDGWRYAEDKRGGVLLLDSRTAAERHAANLTRNNVR